MLPDSFVATKEKYRKHMTGGPAFILLTRVTSFLRYSNSRVRCLFSPLWLSGLVSLSTWGPSPGGAKVGCAWHRFVFAPLPRPPLRRPAANGDLNGSPLLGGYAAKRTTRTRPVSTNPRRRVGYPIVSAPLLRSSVFAFWRFLRV